MLFQTSNLQPPHAPRAWRCFLFQDGLAPDSLGSLSAVLRTSCTTRSLVSRISAVSSSCRSLLVGVCQSRGCLFTFGCSPPHLAVTQLLSVTGGKLRQRGTFTLLRMCPIKRTSAAFTPQRCPPGERFRKDPTDCAMATALRPEGRLKAAPRTHSAHSSR